jgi:hypothetical protein
MILFGGGSGAERANEAYNAARKKVKEVIVETERQKEIRSGLKQMNKILNEGFESQQKTLKKVYRIAGNEAYEENPPQEDYAKLFDVYTNEIAQLRNEYFKIRFSIKEIMTEEEWEAIFESATSM